MCSTSSTGHQPWKCTHHTWSAQTPPYELNGITQYPPHTWSTGTGLWHFYGILATRIDRHQLSVPCDLEIMHKRMKEKKPENKHVMHCTCAKPLSFLCHVCQFCYIPLFFLHVCSPVHLQGRVHKNLPLWSLGSHNFSRVKVAPTQIKARGYWYCTELQFHKHKSTSVPFSLCIQARIISMCF